MPEVRIMVVDDHSLVREGIIALLGMQEEFNVVGEASDGREAIKTALKLRPDVILMDISMPGLGGMEATLEIRKDLPDTRILVLSQYDDMEYVNRFLKAGVSGYVLKSAGGAELIAAVKAVSRGASYLDPTVAQRVIQGFVGKREDVEDPYDLLTDREKQVLKLIAEGYTHKEVAGQLNISGKTVVAHQSNISEKLGLHTKAELMKFAIGRGIIKL